MLVIDNFLRYLKDYKNYSDLTIKSYGIDLREFSEYIKKI